MTSKPEKIVAVLVLATALAMACQAPRQSERDWAEVPIAGPGTQESARLVDLMANPDAYRGRTVRMSLRVVATYRDARGVWLRVVEGGSMAGSQYAKLLIPKGQRGGRDYLELAGRDVDIVLRVERPTSTMAYETAFEVTPVAHVSRFSSSSRGGEDAAAMRDEIDGSED